MAELDISPELLEELKNEFWKQYNGNGKINAAVNALRGSEGLNYKEAYNYTLEVGKSLSEALREKARSNILPDGRMYYNIADKALRPMLENNYRLISDYCVKTQNALNERAGIGIKGVAAPINEDRVNGLLNVAATAQQFDDIVGEFCRECENYSLSVVDEHIKKNAEIQNSAGLSPKIERYCGHSGCDWCSSLAGTYEYEKVKDTGNDVFRRHRGCTCTVAFIPINGKAENAHSKYYIPDKELLELRKNYVGVDRSGRGGIIEGKGGLSKREETAIYTYISSASYIINEKLRNGQNLTDEEQQFVKSLDSALNKFPKFEGIVYRSLSSNMMSNPKKFWDLHQPGCIVQYSAYTSASFEIYDDSMDIQCSILSKTGRDISSFNRNEQEVLFGRDTIFRISSVEDNHIYLEEW